MSRRGSTGYSEEEALAEAKAMAEAFKPKPQASNRFLTEKHLKIIAEAVGSEMKAMREALEERIERLEQEQIEYCKIWKAGRAYRKGQHAIFGGALYVATRDYPDRPRTGPKGGWQLADKRNAARPKKEES
jgi:hypothetical protein